MNKTKKMVFTAMLAALTCISTMIIKIPTPTNGYLNLGDVMVLFGGYVLGPVWGGFAAGLGSAMADILSGYTLYAPATFIIKAAVSVCAYFISKKIKRYFIAGAIAEVIMIIGYFIFESLLLGQGISAAAGIPGNCIQGIVGVLLSSLLMTIKPLKNIQ